MVGLGFFPIRTRHRFRFALIFAAFPFLDFFNISTAIADELMAPVPVALPAPVLQLPELDGSPFSLNSRTGRYTIVNFWALWCAPCQSEMTALGLLQAAFSDMPVDVVAVNLGDRKSTIERFVKRVDTGGVKILLDQTSETMEPWRIQGLPVTFVVSPKGEISHAAIGMRIWDSEESILWFRDIIKQNSSN